MVSIIIPVYNGASYLEEAIQSCTNQSIKDIEIIVINDCSIDESEEIIIKYKKKDSRIRYIKNVNNSGMCASINEGIEEAKGNYILVLGQDDLLEQNHLAKSLEYFVDNNVVATYCNYSLVDENSVEYKDVKNCTNRTLDYHDFMYYNPLHSCGLLMRTDILRQVGGYPVFEEFPQYGEWYLWIKLIKRGKIVFAEGLKPKYRRHKNNLTNTFIDSEQKRKLNSYWDKCRLLLLKSGLLNNMEKQKLLFFVYWGKVRRFIKRNLIKIPLIERALQKDSKAHWF